MSGVYFIELADWLRAAGIAVIEFEGWQTRARGSGGYTGNRPWCVMWHHTASNASIENDAAYCAVNAEDAPICNLIVNPDGSVTVIAAGCSNTNGKGRPLTFSRGTVPQDQMNTHAIGMEIANNGVGEAYPQEQIDAAFATSLALCSHLGLEPDDCAGHWDYSPDRKIDPATADAVQGDWNPHAVTSSGTWSLDDLRAECRARAGSTPPPVTEDDVTKVCEVGIHGIDARFLGYVVTQQSTAGVSDFILWVEWVNGADPAQLARLESYRRFGVPTHMLATITDLQGVALLGPVPTGDKTHEWSRADFGNVI